MKKLLLLALIAFLPLWANAQKGISYQAVILDPNPIEIPGKDITGQPFVNGSVWVKFAILSGSTTQFQEVHQTTTDGYGLVNLTIGSVANTSFNALAWDSNQKSLQVYVSFNQGGTYIKVSDQKLSYLPYALYTETAGKLSGILGITGGGTGAPTAVGARANLGLGNVDNTADVDKPVSNAALTALNLKVDKVAGERLINASEITKLGDQSGVNTGDQDLSSLATKSATDAGLALKAPIASPSFTGTVSGITKAMVGLGSVDNTSDVDKSVSTATQAALDLKVDRVAGERLINASEITKLGNQSGVNTGDQDLSSLAIKSSTDSAIALKAPLASPSFTGTVSGISKAMVGLGSVDNTTDEAKPVSTATQSALDLKVDKVAGERLINASEIIKLGDQSGVNTGDQDLSSLATKNDTDAALALKAPLLSPSLTGIPLAPTAATGTNSTQIATTSFVQSAVSANALIVGSISNNPNSNGATISSGVFQLTPADMANGGVVTIGQQQFSGQKIFVSNITSNNVSVGMPFTGSQNTMLGEAAFGYASPGNNNTALGFMTLASLNNSGNEGNDNTAVGTNALRQGGTGEGSRNTAIGVNSMGNALGSYDNIAIGVNSLNGATGGANTAIGNYTLQNTTAARENVGVGFMSLLNTTIGGQNTAIGTSSMMNNISGDVNTAVGYNSLISNSSGRYNTAIGVQAQEMNSTGNLNTSVGVAANDRNTIGSNNVALGSFAGRYIGDGQTFNTEINNSVLIGSETKPLNNSSFNEIVIGYNATGNGSNTVQLGNANITNVNTSGSITANASISGDITDSFTIDPSNSESYKGKIIICDPANPITITFSSSLPSGFNCMVLQKSADANKITIAGGSGVTIKNRNNYTATAGNYALLTIVHIGNNVLVTAGDMQ